MYVRLSTILFPVALLLLAGSFVWGYQEHQDKNAVLIKAENQYQRAFHDLSHNMSRLHDELGQTLAVSSASQGMQRRGLVKVWRLTSEAQNEVGQLPLALIPLEKADRFLTRIGNFSYRTAVRDLTKQPLTDDELRSMKALYESSGAINAELAKMQDSVLSERLRWMDVETALAGAGGTGTEGNQLVDGFRSLDKQMGEYPEDGWGPSAMTNDTVYKAASLSGQQTGKDEIIRKAGKFLGRTDGKLKLDLVEEGGDTELPVYTVTAAEGDNKAAIQLEYTRKGGHLLWFMNQRQVRERQIDFDTALGKSGRFLASHGYAGMKPVAYDEYDHVAVFAFVRQMEGVRIYSDKLTVRVALDNGEIVGLQASEHVFAPKLLKIGKPKLGKEAAQKALNANFKLQDYSLAVIENELKLQVLCHEFLGEINGRQYRIFINDDSGAEESIEEIPDSARPLYT